jgi:pilus assembly protein Flp/PilA
MKQGDHPLKFLNEIATKIAVRFQNAKDEAGQTLVEYGLIVALISIVAITALALVGSNVSAVFDDVAGELTGTSGGGS